MLGQQNGFGQVSKNHIQITKMQKHPMRTVLSGTLN